MPVTLLPSAISAAVSWLKNQPTVTAITGSRVGTRLNATLPAIRVQRVGNPPPAEWADDASIQIECWAQDEITAELLARTVIAALPDIRGYPVTGGRVHTYTVSAGPYFAPDEPPSTLARFVMTVDLLTTP